MLDKGDLFPPNDINLTVEITTIDIINVILKDLFNLIQKGNLCKIVKNAITKSENSLFTLIITVTNLEEVCSKEFDEFAKITCKKIEEWATDERLIYHRDSIDIIYFWNK